jgi:predicted phage terminase large subunit-like protein
MVKYPRKRMEEPDLRVKALTSLRAFCDLIKFRGGCKNFSKVHLELMDWLEVGGREAGTRKLLLMPRGHLKSTIVSQLYVLWRIYKNSNIRIFLDCNSLSLSRKHLRVIDTYLRDAVLQETVWNNRPHIAGPLVPNLELSGVRASRQGRDYSEGVSQAVVKKILWNAYAKQIIRPNKDLGEPTITAGSLGSAVTGQHYDLYIPDDLVDRKNSKTEVLRDKIEEHLAEIESVLDPWNEEEQFGNEIFMLGTRYYREDAYSSRQKDPEWDTFIRNIYANGVNYDDGTLWPERFTKTYLTRKKNSLFKAAKSKDWFSQYLNQIIDDETAVFKRKNFRYFDQRALVRTLRGWELRRANGQVNIWLRPVLMVDWAFTANKRSDFNAIIVLSMDPQGRIFVLAEYIKKCLPSELYPHILKMAQYWNVVTIGMESIRAWEAINGFKKYMLDKAFNNGKIWPIVEVGTSADKTEKIVTTLEPYYASGRIIHNKTLHNGTLEDQLLHFPEDKDDGPDALAMGVQLALAPRKPKKKPQTPSNPSIVRSIIGGTR